jgi:hypothetical protein
MANARFRFTPSELSFLRWLRDEGGTGARSGSMWIGSTDRLVTAGFIEAHPDKLSPDTVHYTLTDKGLLALEEAE